MHKPIVFGVLVAIIEAAVLINSSITCAQIEGALQYPPLSVGEDAQAPPPARKAPQTVSPRQTELAVSGSSRLPGNQLPRSRKLTRRHRSAPRAAGASGRRIAYLAPDVRRKLDHRRAYSDHSGPF